MCCLIDKPSSMIRQFQRKNASHVPKSPGFSLGTNEWSCPGMINCVGSCTVNTGEIIRIVGNYHKLSKASKCFWSSNRTERYQVDTKGMQTNRFHLSQLVCGISKWIT